MTLTLNIEPEILQRQIEVLRKVMKLQSLSRKEQFLLSEVLKLLYNLKKEVCLPDEGEPITLKQLLEMNSLESFSKEFAVE